jgi:bifunctional non-homologous end joining protein LigD
MTGAMSTQERDGVALTHLDESLFDGAGATKGDLVDYLDAVAGLIVPGLADRPLSVIRVRGGQPPFMQKNVPDYAPPWIRTVTMWAESSKREVRYALCNDRRTLLWFANQRAVEYHPNLFLAGHPDRPTYLVLDIDPPSGGEFGHVVAAAKLVRQALADVGLTGAVKTSGAKGVHVYVPIEASADDAAAATRAIAVRAERLDPDLATTAFIKDDREGKVFLDSTRAHGASVAAVYSPRARPGVTVSFPVPWDDLDAITPHDFTVHTVPALVAGAGGAGGPWGGLLPAPQALSADLVAEGHEVPIARVQAMHEGKRRARAKRSSLAGWLVCRLICRLICRLVCRDPAFAEFWPGGGRAGQVLAVTGAQAVEDDGQVAVAEFGGAFGAGELDRGHELEDQGHVVRDDAGAQQVLDHGEEAVKELA